MSDPPVPLDIEKLDAAVALLGSGGRIGVLPMQGDSMLPMLHSGQRIAVDFRPGRLRTGDLVLYRQLDYLVVHRLVGPGSAAALRTRGDGRVRLDPPLDPARVRGRVIAIRARDGWWDVSGRRARWYARGVALHALFWATWGAAGALVERGLRRSGLTVRIEERLAAIDLRLLRLVHGRIFPRFHRFLPGEPPPVGQQRLL